MNKVTLQGKITNLYKGRNVNIVTLFVIGYQKNFPQVVFNYSNKDKLNDFKVGDFVTIAGTIKVRHPKRNGGREYYDQYIKGLDISPAQTALTQKFGEVLGGRYTYANDVLIKGVVVYATAESRIANLYVQPDDEKFIVKLSSYENNPESFIEKYPIGTKIYTTCEIQTVRKEKDDKGIFFENTIIKEIDDVE